LNTGHLLISLVDIDDFLEVDDDRIV
jgi:hypothetical protein